MLKGRARRGVFVSEKQFKTQGDTQDYYFLLGVIHSAKEGVRGVSLTYGQTTVNGRFVTTGRIKSVDGYNFIDLDGNQFAIGNGQSGLDWNVSEKDTLTVKGAVVQRGVDTVPLTLNRGKYKSETIYYQGDVVQYDGSSWIYINNTPGNGVAPQDKTYWQTFAGKGRDGIPGSKGKDGNNGQTGPSIVFRGTFDQNKIYYKNSYRCDVVKKENKFYMYKGPDNQSLVWAVQNWKNIGTQFENVATNLLLAEKANIGNWVIREGKITSQDMVEEKPIAILEGEKGQLEFNSKTKIYDEYGKDKIVDGAIKIDGPNVNIIAVHDQYNPKGFNYSSFSSRGIYAGYPGVKMGKWVKVGISASVEGNLVRRIEGADQAAIVGVFGNAFNTNDNPAPTFGGFFFNLMARGLYISVTRVYGDYNVGPHDTYISMNNQQPCNIFLPKKPPAGRFIMIKNHYYGGFTVWSREEKIFLKSETDKVGTAYRGHMFIFVFDGKYWDCQLLNNSY